MPERLPEQAPPPRPEDRAVALFADLDVAQARGDFARAAEAQRELALLGWVVTRRRPRPNPPQACNEAAGRGVAR